MVFTFLTTTNLIIIAIASVQHTAVSFILCLPLLCVSNQFIRLRGCRPIPISALSTRFVVELRVDPLSRAYFTFCIEFSLSLTHTQVNNQQVSTFSTAGNIKFMLGSKTFFKMYTNCTSNLHSIHFIGMINTPIQSAWFDTRVCAMARRYL
jgi:hypothetical protein